MTKMIPMVDFPDVSPVTPQTTVIFYSGIPWDDTYQHVRWYDTREELDRALTPHAVYQMTKAAPIRIGALDIDVPYTEMQMYNMDYCRFVNEPYDKTPHYAFVTNVEWLSANSTRVTLEWDVWQECQFKMELGESWVERITVPQWDDIIGKYTYPENLETGELVQVGAFYHAPTLEQLESRALVFATTFDLSGDVSPVGIYQGTYGGLSYIVMPLDQPDDINTINNWLETVFNKNLADGIVNAYIVPAVFAVPELTQQSITIPKRLSTFGSFTPRCKKCFTYPYKKLVATDAMGNTTEYRYEDFYDANNQSLSDNMTFAYYLSTTAEPSLFVYPQHYKKISNAHYAGMTFSNFSKAAIATDTYKMWLAQNSALLDVQKLELNVEGGAGAIKSLIGMFTNPLGALDTAINTTKNTAIGVEQFLAQKESHKIVPPGVTGLQSNSLVSSIKREGYSFYTMECREEYIGKIDSFFWCFGYAIGDLMDLREHIKSRKYWNYVKTIGCTIKGSLPLDMMPKLRQIFDNGVTIWYTDDIGNYKLDNNAEVTRE